MAGRTFYALAIFTSTIAVSSVASTYSGLGYFDTGIAQEISTQYTTTTAVVSSEVAFDRPETPSERLETFATVLDGAVILPEARCNSPG